MMVVNAIDGRNKKHKWIEGQGSTVYQLRGEILFDEVEKGKPNNNSGDNKSQVDEDRKKSKGLCPCFTEHTPLNTTKERILLECMNVEFK